MEKVVDRERTPQAASISGHLRFEDLFLAEHRRLFGTLCMITGDRFEAEDIGQEAFARVWERWDRVEGIENPRAYLYRVAMNVFRSRLRRARVARQHLFEVDAVSDELEGVDDRDLVVRLLRTLTPRERSALLLTTMLDFSSEEAGRMLGIRASTVRVLTTRARARLTDAGVS